MSAMFESLRDRMTEAVDDVFAEPIALIFTGRDGRADPDRPNREIDAILRTHDQEVRSLNGGRTQGWSTDIATTGAVLKVDRTKYPDIVFQKGDTVQATSRAGTPKYTVLNVDPRSHVRLILTLGDA